MLLTMNCPHCGREIEKTEKEPFKNFPEGNIDFSEMFKEEVEEIEEIPQKAYDSQNATRLAEDISKWR